MHGEDAHADEAAFLIDLRASLACGILLIGLHRAPFL